MGTNIFQNGKHLVCLVKHKWMNAIKVEHISDIFGLTKMIGKEYQRDSCQFADVNRFLSGQRTILGNKKFQMTLFQNIVFVMFFRKMIGNT